MGGEPTLTRKGYAVRDAEVRISKRGTEYVLVRVRLAVEDPARLVDVLVTGGRGPLDRERAAGVRQDDVVEFMGELRQERGVWSCYADTFTSSAERSKASRPKPAGAGGEPRQTGGNDDPVTPARLEKMQEAARLEKMRELATEHDQLAHRSKRARIDGKYVKRAVAEDRMRVIVRKLRWYQCQVPADRIPAEVIAILKAREAETAVAETAEAQTLMDRLREKYDVDRGVGDRRRAGPIDGEAEEAAAFEVVTRTAKSGVRISDDFRDNLIIDRYDRVFTTMRGLKLRHLRSENSEDAVTWNVFRSLRQIDPAIWLPGLARRGLQGAESPSAVGTVLSLWLSVSPPPALLAGGDEGNSEIDVAIESPSWVWFIEAKYRSDIETGTKTRPERDQVLRNIDVGSYYAGTRDFFFSLLVVRPETSPLGAAAVAEYSDFSKTRALLQAHRPDRLTNLRAVKLLTWSDMAAVLTDARASVVRIDEQHYADRALEWMQAKGLVG